MSARFTLEGSAGGAVKAVQDLNKALDEAEKKGDGAAKASKRLQDAAKRVAESVDPQTKYNNKIAELAQLVNKAGLSTEHAEAKAKQYRATLEGVGNAGEKAFGAQALGSIVSMAAGYLSVSAAIGTVTSGMRELAAERQRAADDSVRARPGLGSLSQLAATASNPQAAYAKLVAEARSMQESGAALDENEAGAILFELASAGLSKQDRAFATKLRAKGTLQNVGGAAASFDALTTALGKGEVGTFQEFMSKALAAAAVAPGSFEQLPIAAARAGGSAKQLGVSDEFLLAATAVVGKTLGSVDEGGTQVAAFLKQAEKSGLKLQGLGGVGIVEKIAGMSEKQQGFGGVLGDRAEAIAGFRVLRDNLDMLKQLESQTGAAQAGNLAGVAIGLNDTDPRQAGANNLARTKGTLEQAQGVAYAERQNLIGSIRNERRARATTAGRTSELIADYIASGFGDAMGSEADIRGARQQINDAAALGLPSPVSPDTTKLLEDYERRQVEALERIDRKSNSRVTTRPE